MMRTGGTSLALIYFSDLEPKNHHRDHPIQIIAERIWLDFYPTSTLVRFYITHESFHRLYKVLTACLAQC